MAPPLLPMAGHLQTQWVALMALVAICITLPSSHAALSSIPQPGTKVPGAQLGAFLRTHPGRMTPAWRSKMSSRVAQASLSRQNTPTFVGGSCTVNVNFRRPKLQNCVFGGTAGKRGVYGVQIIISGCVTPSFVIDYQVLLDCDTKTRIILKYLAAKRCIKDRRSNCAGVDSVAAGRACGVAIASACSIGGRVLFGDQKPCIVQIIAGKLFTQGCLLPGAAGKGKLGFYEVRIKVSQCFPSPLDVNYKVLFTCRSKTQIKENFKEGKKCLRKNAANCIGVQSVDDGRKCGISTGTACAVGGTTTGGPPITPQVCTVNVKTKPLVTGDCKDGPATSKEGVYEVIISISKCFESDLKIKYIVKLACQPTVAALQGLADQGRVCLLNGRANCQTVASLPAARTCGIALSNTCAIGGTVLV